jgi:hypothetical protein
MALDQSVGHCANVVSIGASDGEGRSQSHAHIARASRTLSDIAMQIARTVSMLSDSQAEALQSKCRAQAEQA